MRFQVYKQGQLLDDFRPAGSYLFGSDGAGIRRSKVVFEGGLINCVKPTTDSAGLALLWPVEGFGKILLPTTCLPERERPYCLNVEVARARLMQIINRREDWAIFEGNEDMEEMSKEAQDLFVQAVQRIKEPATASQLADRSLRRAMVFSERLTLSHAEALFRARRKAKAFSRGCLGCRVDLDLIESPVYLERLSQIAGFAVLPTSWAEIEPQQGSLDLARLDRAMQVLSGSRMIIGAGPLVSFAKKDLPKWVCDGHLTFEQVRDAAYKYTLAVVNRFARRVHRWFGISGINATNELGFTVEQVREITNAVMLAIKAANPRAFRIIEVTSPWGEYYASVPNTISPLAFMDMVVQSGIGLEAFGIRLRFGKDQPGLHVRDLMQIASILDVFALLGKPLIVTGIEVPSSPGNGPFDVHVAGFWHKPWDQSRQAAWLEQLCLVALSRPQVEAAVFEHLVDRADSVIQHSGLLTERMEFKDAFHTICRFREGIG